MHLLARLYALAWGLLYKTKIGKWTRRSDWNQYKQLLGDFMECYVRLVISSQSLDPDQISKKLGLSHDDSWRSGEKRKNTSILEMDSGLIIKSKKEKTSDLEAHIRSLMELTESSRSSFEDLSSMSDCSVQVACAIYYSEEPPLSLGKDIVNWISSIGASLDIDLYPAETTQA